MKKNLAVLLALLCFTGCGVETTPETTVPLPVEVQVPYETQEVARKYQDVQLTMQSVWKQESSEAQVLLKAAQVFEKQSGAAVQIRWPDEDAAVLEMAQDIDIFQIRAADFGQTSTELALNLTEMAEKANYADKSHEALRQQTVQQCGYLAAIAQVPYLGGVYYNTEVFRQCGIAQAPLSWEEFFNTCQIVYDGGWEPLAMDKDDAVTALELHLRRTIGTEEITRLMGKGHWYEDEPAIAALEQALLFAQAGFVCIDTPADYPAGQNKMALTNCAMMIGTNADCADVENDTLTELDWGVFAYPGSFGSGIYLTADMLMIHKNCENPQAAFDFVMLLTTGEFDQLRADLSQGIPADPTNASPIENAMEVLRTQKAEPVGLFDERQQDAAVKLWTAWYEKAVRHAVQLERSK